MFVYFVRNIPEQNNIWAVEEKILIGPTQELIVLWKDWTQRFQTIVTAKKRLILATRWEKTDTRKLWFQESGSRGSASEERQKVDNNASMKERKEKEVYR